MNLDEIANVNVDGKKAKAAAEYKRKYGDYLENENLVTARI